MKKLTFTLFLLVTALGWCQAQMVDPVHFTSQLKTTDGKPEGEIVFTAKIDPGWHVYSTELGEDGPIEATFNVVKMDGVEKVGKLTPKGNVIKKFDNMFGMELKYFENTATFVQKVKFTKPDYDIDCYLEFGACNDQSCMPPSTVELKQKGKAPAVSGADIKKEVSKEEEVKASPNSEASPTPSEGGDVEIHDTADSASTSGNQTPPPSEGLGEANDLWTPVISELRGEGSGDNLTDHSLLYILLMGFVG